MAQRRNKTTSIGNSIPGNIYEKHWVNSRRTGEKSNYLLQQKHAEPVPRILHPGTGKECLSNVVSGRHGHIRQGMPEKQPSINYLPR